MSLGAVTLVEDDASVRSMLETVLRHEGYEVSALSDAESLLAGSGPDPDGLVVLDIGLPGVSGLDAARMLRRRDWPGAILMLTARHRLPDRVAGLDAGADDYLVKPFALDELLARVRAGLRRVSVKIVELGLDDLVLDARTRTVTRAGRPLDLTKIEFDLLELLVSRSPEVLDRSTIHEQVWGHDPDHMSNSLEVFVSQLRRKTEAMGGPRLIHTVRGVGYVARV